MRLYKIGKLFAHRSKSMKLTKKPNQLGYSLYIDSVVPCGAGQWYLNNIKIFEYLFDSREFYSGYLGIAFEAADILRDLYFEMGFQLIEPSDSDIEDGIHMFELREGFAEMNMKPLQEFKSIRLITLSDDKLVQIIIGKSVFKSYLTDFERDRRSTAIYFDPEEGESAKTAFSLIHEQTDGILASDEVEGKPYEYIIVTDEVFTVDLTKAFHCDCDVVDPIEQLQVFSCGNNGVGIKGGTDELKADLYGVLGWSSLQFNCTEGVPYVLDMLFDFLKDSGFQVYRTTTHSDFTVLDYDNSKTISKSVYQLLAIFKHNTNDMEVETRSINIRPDNSQLQAFGLDNGKYFETKDFEKREFTTSQLQFATDIAAQAGSEVIDGEFYLLIPIKKAFELDLSKFTRPAQKFTVKFSKTEKGHFVMTFDGEIHQSQTDICIELNKAEGVNIYGLIGRENTYFIDPNLYDVEEFYRSVLTEIVEAKWVPQAHYIGPNGLHYCIDFNRGFSDIGMDYILGSLVDFISK
jgi:hypothetical protein